MISSNLAGKFPLLFKKITSISYLKKTNPTKQIEPLKRVFKKFTSFQEAEEWEIIQQIKMTPFQRQAIAKKLREKFYGKNNSDVREFHRKK